MITKLVCALFLLAVAGVNQPASAASNGASKPPEPQIQRTPGDAQIERTLKAKLAKSKLSSDHFTFSVSKGVVTIEGTTSVMQHKGVMTRMAKLSGATTVRNNIRVSDDAKAKAAATLAKHRATSSVSRVAARGATGNAAAVSEPIPRATVLPAGTTR